ncbi:MAG TPA: polymorphic toxin-type HINT domain-containing protein [Phycisphaerales bacterium]|nr:polymorphic toxin-type HINT domain-containing protein [Phycisphaerales bacterium]
MTRPTLRREVDLVTGKPLTQVVDLEIPFGSAVFRLVRTRAEDGQRSGDNPGSGSGRTAGWDWGGGGWMLSENPVLLVDSAFDLVVGNNPRTTFLILDALHTIPFQQIEDTGLYEAPARFQARMTHNGTWNSQFRQWVTPPTQYVVSLYGGALHYTFVVTRDDLPDHPFTPPFENVSTAAYPEIMPGGQRRGNLHMRPFLLEQLPGATNRPPYASSPGMGIPYTGICVRIEDNHGNRVDITYCDTRQQSADLTNSYPGDPENPSDILGYDTECVECMQTCASKGQIDKVTLSVQNDAGDWNPVYTLLYAFRATSDLSDDTGPTKPWTVAALDPDLGFLLDWPRHASWWANNVGPRVLDSVYVYPQSSLDGVPATEVPSCNVVDRWTHYERREDAGDESRLTFRPASHPLELFAQTHAWTHRVLYGQSLAAFSGIHVTPPANHVHPSPYYPEFSIPWPVPATTDYIDPNSNTTSRWVTSSEARPLLVTMQSRATAQSGTGSQPDDVIAHRIYVYASELNYPWHYGQRRPQWGLPGSDSGLFAARLAAVLEHRDIDNLVQIVRKGVSAVPCGSGGNLEELPPIPGFTFEHLANWSRPVVADAPQIPAISTYDSIGPPNPFTTLTSLGSWQEASTNESCANRSRYVDLLLENADIGLGYGGFEQAAGIAPAIPSQSGGTADTRSWTGPSWNDLTGAILPGAKAYLTRDNTKTYSALNGIWHEDLGGSVGVVTLRSEGGERRSYRILRFAVDPSRRDVTIENGLASESRWTMHAAAFHPPFQWHGYQQRPNEFAERDGDSDSTSTAPADLSKVRWINVIDEFDSWQNMMSPIAYSQGTHYQYRTKPGQLSRRVVELNASGIVLRDRRWDFDFSSGSAALTSDGLGEEFVYELAVDVLARVAEGNLDYQPDSPPLHNPQPCMVDPEDASGGCDPTLAARQIDHFEKIRSEMILVEYRTLGWAVAEKAQTSESQGLVHFMLHRPVRYAFDATPLDNDPDDGLVKVLFPQLVAEGIKPGSYFTLNTTTGRLEAPEECPSCLITRAYFRSSHSSSLDSTSVPPVMVPGENSAGTLYEQQWVRDVDVTFTSPVTRDQFLDAVAGDSSPQSIEAAYMLAPPLTHATSGAWAMWEYSASHWLRKHQAAPANGDVVVLPLESQVRQTLVVGSPRRQRPLGQPGSAWMYPIQRDWFDDRGQKEWSGEGLVFNPLNPMPGAIPVDSGSAELQTFVYTRYLFDGEGRPLHIVTDVSDGLAPPAHEGASPFNVGDWTFPSDGPGRIAHANTSPLQYVTSYRYEGDRLSDIFYPNGRVWASRLVTIDRDEYCDPIDDDGNPLTPPIENCQSSPRWLDGAGDQLWSDLPKLPTARQFIREYIFNELEASSLDPNTLYSRVLGEIREYAPGQGATGTPTKVRRVYYASSLYTHGAAPNAFGPIETPVTEEGIDFRILPDEQPEFVMESEVRTQQGFTVDANGRAASVELLEHDSLGALVQVGYKSVNRLVDLTREREVDGTITRTIHNLIGQPTRIYMGSDDRNWSSSPSPGGDNLVLVSRFGYGNGINDVRLPTHSWKYRTEPDFAASPWESVSTDQNGALTQTYFDWRSRPVRVDRFDYPADGMSVSSADRLTTELTFYDHADRPVFVIVYGRSCSGEPIAVPSSLDPLSRDVIASAIRPDDADSSSEIAQLLSLPDLPVISAVGTFYGPNGDIVELRNYDVSQYRSDCDNISQPTAPDEAPRYHATISLNGFGDQQVYAQRPGTPVSIGLVDGVGRIRETLSAELAATGQVGKVHGRTVHAHDADGNVVDTTHFERVSDSMAELSDVSATVNAVRNRVSTWFDPSKRTTASLVLGSENAEGLQAPTGGLFVRVPNQGDIGPRIIPTQSVPTVTDVSGAMQTAITNGAQFSVNRYNLVTGRLTHTARAVSASGVGATVYQFDESIYDRAGRLSKFIENRWPAAGQPSRETEYEYKWGRLTSVQVRAREGTHEPGHQNQSKTQIVYVDSTGSGASEVQNGAPVLEYDASASTPTYRKSLRLGVASANHSLVKRLVKFEGDNPTQSLHFAYTFSGLLARRVDHRGVAFQYFYDGIDRLTEIQVGTVQTYSGSSTDITGAFTLGLPSALALPGSTPASMVMRVKLQYDHVGRLHRVTSYGLSDAEVVSDNVYLYDQRGNLLCEAQSHGTEVTNPLDIDDIYTPRVKYTWGYRATSSTDVGFDRLLGIQYPSMNSWPNRLITFDYGASPTQGEDSTDSKFNRIRGIRNFGIDPQFGATRTLAMFGYAGTHRRVERITPSVENQWLDPLLELSLRSNGSTPGLDGLDRFGRDQRVAYTGLPATGNVSDRSLLFSARYGYDRKGNRLFQDVAQPIVDLQPSGQSTMTARSQIHSYDALDRLVRSEVGRLTTSQGVQTIAAADSLRVDQWSLDIQGNWTGTTGTGAVAGRSLTALENGLNPPLVNNPWGTMSGTTAIPWMPDADDPFAVGQGVFSHSHEVNSLSELESVVVKTGPSGNTTTSVKHIFDAAGNLAFDGTYRYSYDAWNRLVQINEAVLPINAPAKPSLDDIIVGSVNRHFTYDGLGRLIRTQRPFTYEYVRGVGTQPVEMIGFLSERYYYDGIRRIQEVRINEVFSQQESLSMLQAPEVQQSAQEIENATTAAGGELEQVTTPIGVEAEQLALSIFDLSYPLPFSLEPQLFREYVYGPGDGPGGVDEILAFYDGTNRAEAYFVLQDASGDVVALVDDNGPARSIQGPAGTTVVPTPRVVAQWTYDAYGQVLSADYMHPHPTMMAGHKGLFVERLDLPLSWQTGVAAVDVHPRLVPFAHIIYQNRNRTYAPHTGRFMQSDPNGTGMVALESIAYHGATINPHAAAADLQTLHTDGANFYGYLRGNPFAGSDPLGLYSDPFDMIDDFMAATAAERAAFISGVGRGSKAAAIMAATIASYVPLPGMSVAAELALYALGQQSWEMTLVNIGTNFIPGGKLMAFLGKLGHGALKTAMHYAQKAGAKFLNGVVWMAKGGVARAVYGFGEGLIRNAAELLSKGCRICFTGPTEVWTERGLVRIADVQVGDLVLAHDEKTGELSFREVLKTYVRQGAPIVLVTLMAADPALGNTLTTIETTEEHPFLVEATANGDMPGWTRIDALSPGDTIKRFDGLSPGSVVVSVQFTSRREQVHNLEVEGLHTYLVGADGVVVHNDTIPTLPPNEIVSEGQFQIRHQFGAIDASRGGLKEHPPAHVHLIGPDGKYVSIGQNGHPLHGERELTRKEREFVQRHLSRIRSAVDKIMRWHRACRTDR